MFSIDGLVSGLDTTSIIEGLVSIQRSQVDRLNLRKDEILTKQTAFQGIEARILSMRSSMSQLNRTSSSVFDKTLGTSSDESILTVTTSSKAIEGSYVVRVNSLAKAHQIGSQGFDSDSSTITSGTISFQVGDRPATEITIDESNNTIDGLINAINTQSDDISASVVFDQANQANRILLTSRHTGQSNQITVTNNLAATSGSATRPDFSGQAIQEAANAAIQLGSGPGAIVAEYDTNKVEGLISNVTIDLLKVDTETDVTINITRDTEAASTAIRDFVDEYNSIISYIDEQTQFNTETNVASPLLGNRNVSTIKDRLGALITETVPGLGSDLNRFSQIGIEIDTRGRLSINSAELDRALNGEIEGVDSSDIRRLFGLTGESTNSNIEFLLGSTRTLSTTSGYEVDILQAAERGSATATNALAASVVIDSSNNQIQLSVDGQTSETLTLADGTYTQEELAAHLESRINNSTQLKGVEVAVSLEGGALEITSASYGLSSEISSFAGTALSTLGFTGSESGQGKDVAGSFIVDGVVETATGSGRVLIGDSDNENTADLQIRVTLDSTQVGSGSEGVMTVTRGISSRMDKYFGDILDPDVGTLKNVNEDFDLRVESLEASIARVNTISEAKTQFLIEQFTALERVLSDLQSTSSFLTSQLAGI